MLMSSSRHHFWLDTVEQRHQLNMKAVFMAVITHHRLLIYRCA